MRLYLCDLNVAKLWGRRWDLSLALVECDKGKIRCQDYEKRKPGAIITMSPSHPMCLPGSNM